MTQERISLTDIKNALKNDELIFYYQPKVSMLTGKIIGAEALIRWKKSDGTLVPPMEFIPLAEDSGYITEITRAIFQKLIVDIKSLSCNAEKCVISFNASAKDFHDSKFVDDIRQAIKTKNLNPHQLEIELTESSLSTDYNINKHLSSLIELGLELTMDDFGTGYSSIDALSKSQFSSLKIDRGIINKASSSGKGKEIVDSCLQMGYQLGLTVVAEGIETARTYTALQHLGCTVAQGYWISRPLPLQDFITFIQQDKLWPASGLGVLYLSQLEHIRWRKEIIEYALFGRLQSLPSESELPPPIDYKGCGLAKWYYGNIGSNMVQTTTFRSLESPHTRMHELGTQLLEVCSDDCKFSDYEHVFHDFKIHSNMVLTLLQQLEYEYLLRENESITKKSS